MFEDWFDNYFLHAVKTHSGSKGLLANFKILLILDNCSACPSDTVLNKENVEAVFLPPN